MSHFDQRNQSVHTQYNINISTLSELDRVDEALKQKILSIYEGRIGGNGQPAQFYRAVGLHYLDIGLYDESIEAFQSARKTDPSNANTFYYLGLAHVAGKALRSCTLSQIRTAESFLDASMRLGMNQAHLYYLWVLIKYDFYRANGLRETAPSLDELLESALSARLNPIEIAHLLQHIEVSNSPIWQHLVELVTDSN